jgi:hypothetical protein
MTHPRHVVFTNNQCPGDVLMITAAVKALHQSNPAMFLTDYHGNHGNLIASTVPGNNLFANNPYITPLNPHTSQVVRVEYGAALQMSGNRPHHFLYAVVEDVAKKLGVHIDIRDFRGDVYLSAEEREPWPGLPERYALINAGYKNDFTAKMWSHYRYQQVVNATKDEIAWVQVGGEGDNHQPLDNVINLVGKTNLREMCRVMYRASLVLCPITFHMHLAAAVPTPADGPREIPLTIEQYHERGWHQRQAQLGRGNGPAPLPGGSRKNRPCIVLNGQREPPYWDAAYPGSVVLGSTGKLTCGVGIGEFCWRNKTVQIDRDPNVCFKPMRDEEGVAVPECLHRVTVDDVVRAVRSFL